jgi:thiol-disulfide isomerase/thioredoxin
MSAPQEPNRESADAAPSSRPLVIAMIGFTLLGIGVLAAFIHERWHPGPRAESAPVAATAASAAAIPETRPEFTLSSLDGHRHAISEWDGKTLLVNFWATWCAPCRHEIPLLGSIRREYASKNVEIVGIAVDVAQDVRTFLQHTPIDYPVLTGEQDALDAAQAFGVNEMAFPFTAFIDAHGHVLTVHLGELHEAQARAILDRAVKVSAGELDPTAGRAAIRAALAALPPPAPADADDSPAAAH